MNRKLTVSIDGKNYSTAPEQVTGKCTGCAAQFDGALCSMFHGACGSDRFIWVPVPAVATNGADEQTDDCQGSALIKQAVMA